MGLKLACGFFASFDDMKIADFLSKKMCNCERGSGRWKDWVRGRQAEQLAFQRSISSNDYFTMKGLEVVFRIAILRLNFWKVRDEIWGSCDF